MALSTPYVDALQLALLDLPGQPSCLAGELDHLAYPSVPRIMYLHAAQKCAALRMIKGRVVERRPWHLRIWSCACNCVLRGRPMLG